MLSLFLYTISIVAGIYSKQWEAMTQSENGLLAIPKILPAEDGGAGMLDWVCTVQYRGTGNCVGFFLLVFWTYDWWVSTEFPAFYKMSMLLATWKLYCIKQYC